MFRILRNIDVKTTGALTAALVLLAWSPLPAEETGVPARRGAPEAGAGFFESQTLLQMLDRAFDAESDSFDPEEGSMQWKGRNFNVGNSRLFKARFVRYLDTPDGDFEQDADYQDKLDEIFSKLSTRNREDPEANLDAAWLMLFEAAEFEADSANSLVIANLVYNAWRVRTEHRASQASRGQLAEERATRRDAVMSRERALLETTEERARDGGTVRPGVASRGSDLAHRQQDLAEVEARMKILEGHSATTAQQAKLQFQSQILSFFFQRRFQHALISTSFYRMIFKGTAQGLEVGEKEMNDFMPDSDLVPSIETLEFLAREAIADVGAGMSAVEAAYRENRHVNALHRLQETFFLGEHVRSVQRFDYEKRQNLLRVYQKMEEARKLADLKDYDQVETLAREIAEQAADFRLNEALSAVRSVKQMSNLALFAAQQGMATGDVARAEEGLERSARIWPLNPALESFTRQIASQVDVSTQASLDFDKQYSQGQYRQIFERRSELLPGVFGDEQRGDQMRTVMDNVGRIDMFLAQSREMIAQDNPFAAWEMLAAAAEIDPNDVVLNREKAQLAPRVASFAGTLDAASRHERDGNYAVSLSRYLEVRELYPASRLARRGIERVGEKLMDRMEFEMGGREVADEFSVEEL